jgi:tRNA threonylcarbamoyladenosine biosynthesis protein TsaB
MILYINTQDRETIEVSLKKDGPVIKTLSDKNKFGSQVLLPLINKLLKEEKLTYQDLKGIEVAKGSGSFTGLRVGVSVANALGFSLGIRVNGKELETDLLY